MYNTRTQSNVLHVENKNPCILVSLTTNDVLINSMGALPYGLFFTRMAQQPPPVIGYFFKSSKHFVFCFNAHLTISDHIQARARRTALNQSEHSSDSKELKSSSRIESMANCPFGFPFERANYCTTNSSHDAQQNMSRVALNK